MLTTRHHLAPDAAVPARARRHLPRGVLQLLLPEPRALRRQGPRARLRLPAARLGLHGAPLHLPSSLGNGFMAEPTLLWFHGPLGITAEEALDVVSLAGMATSLALAAGLGNAPLVALTWLLYLSLVKVNPLCNTQVPGTRNDEPPSRPQVHRDLKFTHTHILHLLVSCCGL